ncbi:MAG: alpha-L-fucosidase [Bacteroidetes bacterium]|nr:alpha-L-fucosidase [Bacteroidota bacterium]
MAIRNIAIAVWITGLVLNLTGSLFAQTNANVEAYKNSWQILPTDSKADIIAKAAHTIPTPRQYAALKNEFFGFICLGPNTFTGVEWGSGIEDPAVFDLKNVDTDQWCKAMKAAGMKMVVIVAKHHDGFVLWQSRYTNYGVMSSPFKNGKGDIVKELSASCKKYGLKLGVYLSPADLNQMERKDGLYGNGSAYSERTIPRAVPGRPFTNKTTFTFKVDDYNEYFLNQLYELLTEYGPISEVWFDGAHPKHKGGQTYNYPAWRTLIRKLAPKAVIFGKDDVRWCGNESGRTRATEWNVMPYPFNPDTASYFPDFTAEDLASDQKLYNAKYLHYQQAETNTSIREGWYYRDDTEQKVRSADDVFDIYERAVGGNSTFMLNIPPNRQGSFSERDVNSLVEAGKRIRETYSHNLFAGASGAKALLDNNAQTYVQLKQNTGELLINTPKPITINRLMLQEAILSHGERVAKHALDAWINNQWKEIASATNIGYKRILRFPEVTASKFRIRILDSRAAPAISTVAAYYYRTRPPQLEINTDFNGFVSITPKIQDFNWKTYGENAAANINSGIEIRYTTDGTLPDKYAKLYTAPLQLSNGVLKAAAFSKTEMGSIVTAQIGIPKKDWKLVTVSSEQNTHTGISAFDANPKTFWQSNATGSRQYIIIDLNKNYHLKGFAYTPQTANKEGMMQKGVVSVSTDGKNWIQVGSFQFGNLINDPTKRNFFFQQNIDARFVKIEATEIANNGNSLSIAEIDFYE